MISNTYPCNGALEEFGISPFCFPLGRHNFFFWYELAFGNAEAQVIESFLCQEENLVVKL
jgi:hypothetical protein